MLKQSKTAPFNLSEESKILQQCKLSYEHSHAPSKKFSKCQRTARVVYSKLVANVQGTRKIADYGPLGQKYLGVVLTQIAKCL